MEEDFYFAIKNNDCESLEQFLASGLDVNHNFTKDLRKYPVKVQGRTLLHVAVCGNHTDIVRMLVKHKCDINAIGQGVANGKHTLKDSSLYTAMCKGFLDIVKVLVKAGADLHMKDESECTPLWHAVDLENWELVVLLLSTSQEDIINTQDRWGLSPLHVAVVHKSEALVDLLLAQGAKVDLQQAQGATPLQLACCEGEVGIVRTLLQHGADPCQTFLIQQEVPSRMGHFGPEILDPVSCTLRFARKNKVEIIRTLFDAGAKFDVISKVEDTGTSQRDLIDECLGYSKTPRCLKVLCSLVVKSRLRQHSSQTSIKQSSKLLPLPKVVKNYILLTHI